MRIGSRVIVVVTSTALAGLSLAGINSGAAAAHPKLPAHVAVASKLDDWRQLSSGTLDTTESIGLGRFGDQVQAVWRQDSAGDTQTLHTRIVSKSGKPVGSSIVALPPWGAVNDFPAIIPFQGGRLIAFGGLQDDDSSNPYSQGYEYYLTSADGRSWTLADGTLSYEKTAYGSYGTDAADVNGSPVVAYTDSSSSFITYHRGTVNPIPAAPSADPHTGDTGPDAYNTGLGYDAGAGQTWAVWYSNSAQQATEGVSAQQILPTLGTVVQAPGSAVKNEGIYKSVAANQRIVVGTRDGGGLYAGYAIGYPYATKVALWQLGADHALVRPGGKDVERVATAAGPGGRMWLYWWNGGTHTIEAARTNPAVSRYGAVCQVTTPNQTENIYDIEGDGAMGPLQLFINAGEAHQQIYSTVVHPCLGVSVSPARIRSTRGGEITVTVSDAGSPVDGATVHFAGTHKVTNRVGKVSFVVPRGTSKGRHSITVSADGYRSAAAHLIVH